MGKTRNGSAKRRRRRLRKATTHLDGSSRCPAPCGKRRYSEFHCQLAALRAYRTGLIFTWYPDWNCRCWHLTSQTAHLHCINWLQTFQPPRQPIPTIRHAGRVHRA